MQLATQLPAGMIFPLAACITPPANDQQDRPPADISSAFAGPPLQITPYRAGHVLGAAMFMVEIDGMSALYTGDYSRLPDRHLSGADTPPITPHIVIVESTYGTSRHPPALEREKRFIEAVHNTVVNGGRVLMPIVALGRAQVRCC
jgi:Cft2 family RNA processing exonuclease